MTETVQGDAWLEIEPVEATVELAAAQRRRDGPGDGDKSGAGEETPTQKSPKRRTSITASAREETPSFW